MFLIGCNRFSPFLFKKYFFLNLVFINLTKWLTIPVCLMCIIFFNFFLNKGSIEGTNSLKICVSDVCLSMYVLFCTCVGINFTDLVGERVDI